MTKLNFVTPTLVLIILALLFYLFNLRSQSKIDRLEAMADKAQLQAEIAKHIDRAKTAGARADSLAANFVRRHAKDSIDLRALSVRNRAMSETVQRLRKPVQTIIDTLAPLREFVIAYDSLLASKDHEIMEIKLRHEGQIIDLTTQLKERGNQILAEAAKAEVWRVAYVESEKKNRKLGRKVTFWKIVGGIAVAWGVYESVKN